MRASEQEKILGFKGERHPVLEQPVLVPEWREPLLRCPLMSMEAAKGVLDRDQREVIALIGTWLIAWDIATPGAGRVERRILTQSISLAAKFLGTNRRPGKWNWSEVIALILSPASAARPWISGVEIRRWLNCSPLHVTHLVECQALKLMPGTTYRRGPGGAPLVIRESFVRFLEQRLEDSRNITAFPSGECQTLSKEFETVRERTAELRPQ